MNWYPMKIKKKVDDNDDETGDLNENEDICQIGLSSPIRGQECLRWHVF